jgi:hypothetical protein
MSHSAYRGASSAILARPPTSVPLLKGSDRDGLGASTSACDQGHALVRRKVSIEEHSPRLCLPPCTVWLGDGVQEMNTTLYNTSTAAELSFRPLFLCVLVREDGYRQGGQKAVWGRVNPTTSLAQTTPSLPLLVGWCCGRSSHPLCTAPAGDATLQQSRMHFPPVLLDEILGCLEFKGVVAAGQVSRAWRTRAER